MDHYDEGMNLSQTLSYTRLTRFSLSIIRFRSSPTCRAGRHRWVHAQPESVRRVTDNMHGETPSSARMTPSPQSVASFRKTRGRYRKRDKDFEEGASAATIQRDGKRDGDAFPTRLLWWWQSNQAAARHVGDASLLGSASRPRPRARCDGISPRRRNGSRPSRADGRHQRGRQL